MATDCGITPAQSNRVKVTYIKEDPACFGVLPTGTQIAKKFRVMDFNPVANKETQISEEIRADRMTSGELTTSVSSETASEAHFTAGGIDDFIASSLSTSWTKDMLYKTVSGEKVDIASTSTITITDSTDYTPYFIAGRYIKLEGWQTPSNNSYFSIASSAFASGVTTITVVGTPLTVESGTVYSKVVDANDVILVSTNLEITSTAVQDKAAATVFAAAKAAGQIEPGAHIKVLGLGLQEGSLALTGLPAANETVTISDGMDFSTPIIYEFVTATGTGTTTGSVEVLIGATAADTATNFHEAVMKSHSEGKSEVFSSDNTTGTVTLRNGNREGGGSFTGTVTNGTVTNLTGGSAESSGTFKIISSSDTAINLSPAPTADTNANSYTVVVKTSNIRPPKDNAITPTSWQLEREYTDLNLYELYKGNRVESWMVEMSTGDLLKTEVNFKGTETVTSTTAVLSDPASHTQLDVLTTPVMNASSDVRAVKSDGTAFPTIVKSATLEVTTDLREQYVLSKKFAAGIGEGRLLVSMETEMYFQNFSQFNDFLNDQYRSYEFEILDLEKNGYVFHIPRGFISEAEVPTGGIDEDIMQQMTINGHFSANENANIVISRFSSEKSHTI